MTVFFTDKTIVHSPEKLISLLEKRIALIWNYRTVNIVQKIIFKPMDIPYEVIPNGKTYSIYFSNDVLLNLINTTKGIFDFDRFLNQIENLLVWKL